MYCLCGSGRWTPDFILARQILYHICDTRSSFWALVTTEDMRFWSSMCLKADLKGRTCFKWHMSGNSAWVIKANTKNTFLRHVQINRQDCFSIYVFIPLKRHGDSTLPVLGSLGVFFSFIHSITCVVWSSIFVLACGDWEHCMWKVNLFFAPWLHY